MDELHLLPALPKTWPEGKVTGLKARGGVLVDLEWKDGQLTRYKIRHAQGLPVKVRTRDKVSEVRAEGG